MTNDYIPLRVIPLELKEANGLVATWHRHHKPSQGHRFSLGVIDEHNVVHGAAIVGRPVARLAGHPRQVLEVVRLVSDGTRNACSMLYAAAARTGKVMGYQRIQTYILDTETGTTLKAAGWTNEGSAGGGSGSIPTANLGAPISRQRSRCDGRYNSTSNEVH